MKTLVKKYHRDNRLSLGLELGSTRIKAILIGEKGEVISSGSYNWENQYIDGNWTYDLDLVWIGIQEAYHELKREFFDKYDIKLTQIGSMGFSAMMHGYLAFDESMNLLVPFRTWRNSTTEEAEEKLTKLFKFNIPQRWSVAHLYQAMLNEEDHVYKIKSFTTLAGYVHYALTGRNVLGIGDASGMFPIDYEKCTYNQSMINKFNNDSIVEKYKLNVKDLLPEVSIAGENAGYLSQEGALLLDPSGDLKVGSIVVPPEGDAGTGMVATNSIKPDTGNVSAGTSVFAMVVLKGSLSKVYPEIDIVTTPVGNPVAMVHVNNCTTELNSWIKVFEEFSELFNMDIPTQDLYQKLLTNALESIDTIDKVISYGYHSGENITKINQGRPLLVRSPEVSLSLSNLMLSILNGAFATLGLGLDILINEGIKINTIVGHGGIFKTENAAEKVLANITKSSVTLMETANEGGAWGMALLAQYVFKKNDMILSEYLDTVIFSDIKTRGYIPKSEDIEKYNKYLEAYRESLVVEKTASESLR